MTVRGQWTALAGGESCGRRPAGATSAPFRVTRRDGATGRAPPGTFDFWSPLDLSSVALGRPGRGRGRRGRRRPDHGPVRQGREPVRWTATPRRCTSSAAPSATSSRSRTSPSASTTSCSRPPTRRSTTATRSSSATAASSPSPWTARRPTTGRPPPRSTRALAELGIRADSAKLSVSRSEPLGRSGLALTITTPKNVTVNVDGGSKTVASTGPTVADALQQLEVTLGAQDRVNPAPETPLTEGLAVTINRVEKKSVSETQAVAFGVTNQDDATLAKGTKKTTTKGVAGEQSVTFDEVWVDGKLESRNQTGAAGHQEPGRPGRRRRHQGRDPDRAHAPGRRRRPPATPPARASTSPTRRCGTRSPGASPASGGTSTSAPATTAACSSSAAVAELHGGTTSRRADLATREQQITVANRLYAELGLKPWTCKP